MSNGPIAPTERCSGIRSSPIVLLTAGTSGALFGLFSSHLIGNGELRWEQTSPLSWLLLIFFFLSTFSVLLIIFYLSSRESTRGGWEEGSKYFGLPPAHPNRLERVRSYLAFFPITHIIQSNNNGESGAGGDPLIGEHVHEPRVGLSGRINVQMDMAIEAIVAEYISPWYTKISDDGSFLDQCKAIIQTLFLHLGEKLRQVDRNDLAKEAIQLIHIHWKEYTDAVAKSRENGNGDDIHKSFRFVHPFLQDNKEVSQRYQKLVSRVLKELALPDLSSPVMCQFLAGILVKNFILFYVDMITQPSWLNGSLMTLLSSGSMSVDITGSSSQNSSSPASPLPDLSSKQSQLFGDEVVVNDCASLCPSLTDNESSSPTKKSCSQSVSALSGSGGSQEELSPNKCEKEVSPQLQRSLESNSSASVDEGTSSEPKTESSAGISISGKGLNEENKWSSSTSSSSMFPNEMLQPLSRRPKDLTPLKSSGPMRTVTTALSKVMQTTAFPLLPSECYTEESSSLTLTDFGNSLEESVQLQGSNLLEEFGEVESIQDDEDVVMLTTHDSVFEHDEDVPMLYDASGKEESDNLEEEEAKDSNQGSSPPFTAPASKTVALHYYSFDEASRRKLTPSSFFETSTLSLDGAIEGRKQQEKDQLQLCSHEYKHGETEADGHTPNASGKPQRSPVYEEPEDFAASIAKLRSLLEQKGRKSSTPPASAGMLEDGDVFESPSDSPAAVSSGGGGSAGTIPQISETCASDTHTTPSSTSSMDISKGSSRFSFNETILNPSESDSTSLEPQDNNYNTVPEIKCCFRNVSIPKVENSADAGGQYIYYCIQYEGVYFDDYDTHPQKLVYRTTTIKRKFKEFLTLQAHLEENAACKPHLKGMKTPTRWLNVSLTKSDATVAHQRRAMLEKYLQQLCYHPVIGFCQEILIFMAYGEDGFCSLEIGDPKDLLTHRLDKLAKKFTGVINSLKDALPSFELDLSHTPHTPKSEGITPSDLKQEANFSAFSFSDKYAASLCHQDQPGHELDESWMEKLVPSWTAENANPALPSKENKDGNPDIDQLANESSSSPTVLLSSEVDGTEPGKIFSVYPLAAAVTHLLCDVLWLPQYRPHPTSVTTFMSISGKSLENYVMETMDIFLSEEAILGYLEWLTISINMGLSDTDSQRCDASNDLFSEQDLKNIMKRRIPAWVRWMWGRNRLDLTIDRLTGLFQSPLVNHDLVLSLSELLFSKMVNLVDEIDAE